MTRHPPAINNLKTIKMKQVFIDQFTVPRAAKARFLERMQINRELLRNLAGFLDDAAYERTDDKGNSIILTLACWESKEALANAQQQVRDSYEKEKFDVIEMLQQLDIQMERGLFTEIPVI